MMGPRSLILSLQLQMVIFFFPSYLALVHHAVHSEEKKKKKAVMFRWGSIKGDIFNILIDPSRHILIMNIY